MNDRNLEQLLDAWLDAGPKVAPGRVTEAARLEIRSTRQPAALRGWPPRRFPIMSNTMRIALATAAVAVAALLGFNYLVAPNIGSPGLGEPSPTPTPVPTRTPVAMPIAGVLAPGTYAIDDVLASRIIVTVPDGWQKNVIPAAVWTANSEAHLGFATVDNVFADPCAAAPVLRDPVVGPTVEDLVTALEGLPGIEVSSPTDVTVAGFAGRQLELTADGTCDAALLWLLQPLDDAGPLEAHARVWIVDVNGERLVIIAQDRAGAGASAIDEMQAMVDSLEIEP